MTVKELKAELEFYDEDAEVVFVIDDSIEVESLTESKYGWKEAHVKDRLKPSFICEHHGDMRIELEVDE